MSFSERIANYIHNPLPIWDEEVAKLVIDYKWNTSLKNIFQSREDYCITGCIFKDDTSQEKTFSLLETGSKIQIVFPSENMFGFYHKHGLVPAPIEISIHETVEKISRAMRILGRVEPLHSTILQLVRSMQVIEAEDPETDVSYSHPDIPFSIFFSVCDDNSVISDLRVAESIVHESMHLMLTLIENQCNLVVPYSQETFYSPWRDEKRPIRGVLHGLYVFRTLLEFYKLVENVIVTPDELNFIQFRIKQIKLDIYQLTGFAKCPSLTKDGANLTANLLPLN